MVVFLAATISCNQALGLLQRITKIVGLTEIRKTISFCPITIQKDGK